MMDFGEALAVLRAGGRVTRQSWGDFGHRLRLEEPGEMPYSRMTELYISIRIDDGPQIVPWFPTQADLFSSDWIEIQQKDGDDF